jgi:hypothetical protein
MLRIGELEDESEFPTLHPERVRPGLRRRHLLPIDSRVEKELHRCDLPVDERALVRVVLQLGRNPREIARMFYVAGGS